MKKIGSVLASGLLVTAVGIGCGGAHKEAGGAASVETGGRTGATAPVQKAAQERFNVALDAFNAHDKTNDWSDEA
ncbi:MAG: hypothetical protein ACREJ3_15415, partial [Polyangiaceae bacterium]